MASREAPRNFFLNETHELSSVDKASGGRTPEYVGIEWKAKSRNLSRSIERVISTVNSSSDPLRSDRFFVIAAPVPELKRASTNRKIAPDGTVSDHPSFGSVSYGKVFDRLGLDLLQVSDDGVALVHGNRERLNNLAARTKTLDSVGVREQSRWVTIDSFDTSPLEFRVDGEWLNQLSTTEPSDVVFECQPILGRVEGDKILRAIADVLAKGQGERLTGTGTDFSGRFWFRGKANRRSVREIAKDFYSVQSIHSPLYSLASATKRAAVKTSAVSKKTASMKVAPLELPCVAVVDLGVPSDHIYLAEYRRGTFVPQGVITPSISDHGSFVASRVVFGHCASAEEIGEKDGECSFYDAVVWDNFESRVNDKVVMEALRGVRGAAPDVRVFNLSFGDYRPLSAFADVELREKKLLMQDLDNFIFANDVIVVVAAGNSQPGVQPNTAYPNHFDDSRWSLGPWSSGFNSLVCGSFVDNISSTAITATVGWPSPFTRIGPGLCDSPVPSFCAEGGNAEANYNYPIGSGLGVWGLSGEGLPEDRVGTSFAAPILARECAFAFKELQ